MLDTNLVNFHQWNRKILNVNWVFAIFIFISNVATEFIALRFHLITNYAPSLTISLLPNILMLLFLFIVEIAVKHKLRFAYDLAIIFNCISVTLAFGFYNFIPGFQFIYILSIFTSLVYFDKRKLLISFGLHVLSFILLVCFHPGLQEKISALEILVTLGVLCNTLIVALFLLGQGREMHKYIVKSLKEQQELMIKTAIIEKASMMDGLTGLNNNKTFREWLELNIEMADKTNVPLHLAVLDLDCFKQVNDTYGHMTGDLVLKRTAQAISDCLTADDFPARYGGEEFAVIFTNKSLDEAFQLCETIREAVSQIVYEEMNGGRVTVSIGLSSYQPGNSKEWLFKEADSNLYKAKKAGRNKVCG